MQMMNLIRQNRTPFEIVHRFVISLGTFQTFDYLSKTLTHSKLDKCFLDKILFFCISRAFLFGY